MTQPTDGQKVDLLFKEFTGVANVLQENTFAEQIKAFRPNILNQDILADSIPSDLSDYSYNFGFYSVYGAPALDASYGETVLPASGIQLTPSLTYYHRRTLSEVTGQTIKTYFIDDGSGNSQLRDTIPFKYDQSYNSYNHVLYVYDPSFISPDPSYIEVGMWSAPNYWLLDNKSGYLELYGEEADIADTLSPSKELRFSYIKYTGDKGITGGGGGGDGSYNDLDVSGSLTVDGNNIIQSYHNPAFSFSDGRYSLARVTYLPPGKGNSIAEGLFTIQIKESHVAQNVIFTAGVTRGRPAVNVLSSAKDPFDPAIVNIGILDGSAVNTAEDNGFHVYADFSNAAAGPVDIRINLTNNNASLPRENEIDWFLQPKQIVVVPPDTYTSLADADVAITGLAPTAYSYETQSHYFGNDLIVGPNSTVIPDSGSRPLNSTQGILSISGDIDVGGSGSFRGTVRVDGTDQHNVSVAAAQGVSAYGRSLSRVSGLSAPDISASGYYDIAGVAVGVNNGYLSTYGITIQAGTRFRLFGQTTSGESHLVEGYASYSASVTTGAVFQNREGGLVVTKSHTNGRVIFSELYIRDDSGSAPPGGYPYRSYTAVFTVKIADGSTTLRLAAMTFELFDNGPNQAFTYATPATSDPLYHSPTYPDASNVTWWDYLGNSNASNPSGLSGAIRAQVDISFNGTMSVNELDRFVVDGSAEFVDISSATACIVDLSCVDTINGLSPALTAESTWTFNPSDATGNDRWYTIAECGTDFTPRVGKFTLLDKQGSRYHSVVLNAGFRTGGTVSANGIYLDAEASAWSTLPNYKGARIAYRASGSGCALQVQATNLPNLGTQYIFLSQNFGTDGWTITANGTVDGSTNFPVLPDGSTATQAKSIALGNTQYDDTGESVTNLNSVFDGRVQVDGPRFNVTSGTSDFSGVDTHMYGGSLHVSDQPFEKSGTGDFDVNGPADMRLTMSGGFERIPSNVGTGIGYTTISGGAVYVRGTVESTGVEALQLRSAFSSRITSGGNMLIASNAEPGVSGTSAYCRIRAAGDLQLYSGHDSGQGRSLLGEVDISAAHRVKVAGHKGGGGNTTSSLQLGDPNDRFFTSVEEPFRLYSGTTSDISNAISSIGASAREGIIADASNQIVAYTDGQLRTITGLREHSFVASLAARRTSALSHNKIRDPPNTSFPRPYAFHMINRGDAITSGTLTDYGSSRQMYPRMVSEPFTISSAVVTPFMSYLSQPIASIGNNGGWVHWEIWVATVSAKMVQYFWSPGTSNPWFSTNWVTGAGVPPSGTSGVVNDVQYTWEQDGAVAQRISRTTVRYSGASTTSVYNPWTDPSGATSSDAEPVVLYFSPFTIPAGEKYAVILIERVERFDGTSSIEFDMKGLSSTGYQDGGGAGWDSIPIQVDLVGASTRTL